MAALGLIFAGKNAPAGTMLQEYVPLHVGDHYTALTAAGTNTVMVEAGVAKYPGSFTLVTLSSVAGIDYTNLAYVGYSGNSEVTYEVDSGSNTVMVLTPPLVTMTESALASLGTPFTGTSWYTNSFVVAGQSFDTVVSETLSGVVSSTGTVTVVAGTFNNCLANAETITTTTTTMGFSTTNTLNQTLFYARNVGCLKVVQGGTNIYELLGGVIGGVTVGGGGGDTQPPTIHITSPADGATVTASSVAVHGTASDNVGVVGVFCRVDGGSWSKAQGTGTWSFQASLSPGANVIEAYAADAAGNLSTTSQVSVTYAPSAQTGSLQVTITPPAAVSAGAEWQVNGGAYQKSAATVKDLSTGTQTVSFKPISGWNTPSNETVTITNGATTKAAGVYTQQVKGNPKLTLSSPKAAQSVSNALLLVTGTVSDKVAVDEVYYQLNGGSWTLATTTNSWTNWTASVTLNPGANTLNAYAQDSSGKTSPTNTVKFTYVVSAPLVVQVSGLGTVIPNYNGKWLKIGTRYSMTATAGKGFGFLKWSGSLSTNKATLSFVMASNLTFTANFVDVTPPVLVILSPKVHQNVSNAVFTVAGKASDNAGVTQVFYQLNGAGWDLADSTNGWTNWTAQVTLSPGTNLAQAYAQNAAGNRSKTNSVSFVYHSSAPADWAPASLSGLSAEAVRAGKSPSTLCFGASTLSQSMLPGTNENQNGVGTCTYTKLGTDTAQVTITWTDPPNRTNDGGTASLTFTNSHAAVYIATNLDGTIGTGALLFSPAANLAPASLQGKTSRSVESASGQASTTVFSKGTFTQTDYQGKVSSGSYTLRGYSPVGVLVVMNYTSPASNAGAVNYSVAIFSTLKAGIWFSDFFDPAGVSNTSSGTFTLH